MTLLPKSCSQLFRSVLLCLVGVVPVAGPSLAQTTEAAAETVNWSLTRRVATDTRPSALVIDAVSKQPVTGLFNRQELAQISVTCQENRTSIRLRFPNNILSDVGSYGVVTYQLDGAAEVQLQMTKAESEDTLGVLVGTVAVPLLQDMILANAIRFDVTAINDRRRSAEFSLAGLSEALEPLRDACNW